MHSNTLGPAEEPTFVSAAAATSEGAHLVPDALQPAPDVAVSETTFPVVCLGGSAGSLSALEDFLRGLPARCGVAVVVVTHQQPTQQEGGLAKVLQHFSALPVHEVQDGMKVRPNHVYVIPPGKDMSMLHGTLHLLEPTQPPGRRLPIDYFLQSLAKDARDRAVCIILSGMGSDGAIGLKMVMENFGMVMVQDPETAQYDSMPRAAVATEFVDYVLPAFEMPAQLLKYVRLSPLRRPLRSALALPQGAKPNMPAHALQKIFVLIRQQTGHDFSLYKRNTVFRRIERRMNGHQLKEFTHYVRYLQENPDEVQLLFKELLIGVTKFFRDAEAYDVLKKHLTELVLKKERGSTIRVWVPGCSTGEEAYSLAITLLECLESRGTGHNITLQIFATDINPEGIEWARAGVYSANIVGDVSPERLRRFFNKLDDSTYQIRKEVRDTVVFALHNINKDAPFTRLDLLCCRNLLIYLSASLQKALLPIFHYALNPEGLLFLGPSENLSNHQDLFVPLDMKWKLSRRSDTPATLSRLSTFSLSTRHEQPSAPPVPTPMNPTVPRREGPFGALMQRTLLLNFVPPAVLINAKGDILYVHGRTGKYLEPAPGGGGMNIFEMAREELSFELSDAVHRAVQERQDVVCESARVKTDAGYQLLRCTVKFLQENELTHVLLLVVFEDLPTPQRVRQGKRAPLDAGREDLVASLEKELQYTRQRLHTTIEEMETSLEELKSTNEELQSANEELQSTNEEAMTNKEEMQSLNEELMTLNMQYMSKTEELSQAANDMKNLLDATEIATVFLDNDMTIKRFTSRVSRIIPLMSTDVGRPITHFSSNIRHERLVEDVQLALDRLVSVETNIQTVSGEWYAMRIMPYRTLDNYISGTVITFNEITGLKQLEMELQRARRYAESIVETVREPLLVLDSELRVVSMSQAFSSMFGIAEAAAKGQPLDKLNQGAWKNTGLDKHLRELLDARVEKFDDLVVNTEFAELGTRQLRLYGRNILLENGQPNGLLLLGVQLLPEPAQA